MLLISIVSSIGLKADNLKEIFFSEDFENGLDKWDLNNPAKLPIIDSGNEEHGKVLGLYPGGHNVHALIKNSDHWTNFKIEGDVLFPENEHNYLGVIYNYNVRGTRIDYGCIYIKGNGSYVRVNPHRDGHVSRVLHEEYRTALKGDSAIVTGDWQHFKMEVMGSVCHFYVGDMETPKLTFEFHEFSSGRAGFEPRVSGSECWIDNVSVSAISEFNYHGPGLPAGIDYQPDKLITNWNVLGPFRRRNEQIEKDIYSPDQSYAESKRSYRWMPFTADGRGCVVSGKIIEWQSARNYAYFHSEIVAENSKKVKLQFSTTNDLQVWLNGKPTGKIERKQFAWYDFRENPEHKVDELDVTLVKGTNHLLILDKGLGFKGYSGDGFYAKVAFQE